jgi:GNAT superfamily N-acetyltransferase
MSITKKITEYLKYIFQKVSRNPSPQIILDGLNKLGINIMPFYVFSEDLFNKTLSHLETGFDEYHAAFLGPEDMKEMSEIPFRNIREETLLKRFKDGKVCFGMKYKGKLAAFTWCDLKSCNFKGCDLTLKEDEAYLFDAHTLPPFRGKGIAPYIRYHLYKEMSKLGKHRFFSISEYFNTPSIKFKEKLGAKKMEMGLLIDLFHRWPLTLRLKRYGAKS